jgi:hypothetical protein
MRRREFIAGIGGVAMWRIAAHAQPQRLVIGHLSPRTQREDSQFVERLLEGLRQTGFTAGRTMHSRVARMHFLSLATHS